MGRDGTNGRSGRIVAGRATLAAALLVALPVVAPMWGPGPTAALAEAQKKPAKAAKPAAKSEEDGDGALKAYDAGVKAWQSGRADSAIDSLTAAIGAGKLPPQQMARALYYRGLAQRKLGKPALAIADLQSALWLKGALTDSERNDAVAARAAAYKEAGIADPSAGKISESSAPVGKGAPLVSASPAVRAPEVKAASPPPAPVAQPAPLRDSYAPLTPRAAPPGSQAVASVPPPAARVAVASPVPASAAASQQATAAPAADWRTNVRGSGRPASATTGAVPAAPAPASTRMAQVAATASPQMNQGTPYSPGPAAAPPTPEPASVASGGSSGGFLSNLFGGLAGSSSSPETAAIPERRVPPKGLQPDPDAGKPPIPDGPITAAETRAPRVNRVVSAAPAGGGNYRLQVAAAKSKADADRIAAQIRREQVKAVGQRAIEVDEAGGVWRVRLGPFASANEPRNICVKLRPAGYDCMVVAR